MKVEQLGNRIDARFANIHAKFAIIEARMAESRANIIQWIVGVAIGTCTIGAAVASFILKHMP